MIGTMLEFARRRGVVEANVARGVQKFSIPKRTRFLNPDEYGCLGNAIATAQQFGESQTGLDAIIVLSLTGCRREEILSLKWDSLDVRDSCLRFSSTKTGPQIRPIGKTALDYLASRPKEVGSQWVFPAERGSGYFASAPRLFQRLCELANLENVTLHTLRHSFASMAARLGYSELIISGLLGHKNGSVTARYAHVPDRTLIQAADAVSEAVLSTIQGNALFMSSGSQQPGAGKQ